jgi:cardiolipin synthase
LNNRRVLGRGETGPLLWGAFALLVLTAIAVLWPRAIAWPLAAIALWIALGLAVRWLRVRRERRQAVHSAK